MQLHPNWRPPGDEQRRTAQGHEASRSSGPSLETMTGGSKRVFQKGREVLWPSMAIG